MGLEWVIIPLISTIVTAVVRAVLDRTIGPTTPKFPPIMSGLLGTGIGYVEDLGVTVGLVLGLAGIGLYEWWHTVIVPFVNGVAKGLKARQQPKAAGPDSTVVGTETGIERDEGSSALQ